MSGIWPLRSEACKQIPMINGYKIIDHIVNYNVLRKAKSATWDYMRLPYSGFYWRAANLAISSFLQIGEDLTWRSLPTSHHTHINIDHTHHEIAIIVIHCMHACSYLVVDQLFWSVYCLVAFTPLLWLLAFCNLQHCLICLSELQFCQR